MELKKATTFDEQVELLRQKNIIISDPVDCACFLSKTNYYRISGYYLPFMQRYTNQCFDNITFERIQNIYYFDADMRNLITSAIEKIEIHIRTQLAYYHAHKYGPEGYMYASSFNLKHDHIAFSKHISSCISENRNTLIVKHHIDAYNGHFPIWVIIDFFSMGMLSYFYRGMKNSDKAYLAQNMYGVNYQIMESWLRCLTDLRNRCAHYSRLYYWIFPALPKMPTAEKYVPTRRLFSQIYMLKFMYPEKSKWNDEFLNPLIKLIRKYRLYISKNHIDFPYRWKSMLKQ